MKTETPERAARRIVDDVLLDHSRRYEGTDRGDWCFAEWHRRKYEEWERQQALVFDAFQRLGRAAGETIATFKRMSEGLAAGLKEGLETS